MAITEGKHSFTHLVSKNQIEDVRKKEILNQESIEDIAPGTYAEFEFSDAMDALVEIYETLKSERSWTYQELKELDAADTLTSQFLQNAYHIYEGRASFEEVINMQTDKQDTEEDDERQNFTLENVQSVFVVPARGEFSAEAEQVLPIVRYLSPDLNPQHKRLFRNLLKTLPPFVLATHVETGSENTPISIIVYSPQDLDALEIANGVNSSLAPDTKKALKDVERGPLRIKSFLSGLMTIAGKVLKGESQQIKEVVTASKSLSTVIQPARESVNEALAFAKRIAPNVRFAGLGAVLPGITDLGSSVPVEKLGYEGVTTGHRTTIDLMDRTMELVVEIDQTNEIDKITAGIIGTGYIGVSAADRFLANSPNRDVLLYDIDHSKAELAYDSLNKKYPGRVKIAHNTTELFTDTPYIFSAATGKIEIPQDLDLSGVIIVDDSEPSSVDPKYLRERGGIMIKPVLLTNPDLIVKEDTATTNHNEQIAIVRKGINYIKGGSQPYDYGWSNSSAKDFGPGLIGERSIFGCEAETIIATILNRKYKLNSLNIGAPEPMENPVLFAKNKKKGRNGRVTAEAMDNYKQIPGLQNLLENTITIDMLQGGGILVGDRVVASSDIRRKRLKKKSTTIELTHTQSEIDEKEIGSRFLVELFSDEIIKGAIALYINNIKS